MTICIQVDKLKSFGDLSAGKYITRGTLFQQNRYVSATLKTFQQIKGSNRGPLTATNFQQLILDFKETGKFALNQNYD